MTHKLGCFGLCQGSECACIIPELWHKLTDTSLKAVFSGSHVLLHDCCWVKGDLKISWPRQCWASLPWQVWWGLTSSLPPAVKAETEQEIMSNTKSKIDLKSSKTRSPNVATSSPLLSKMLPSSVLSFPQQASIQSIIQQHTHLTLDCHHIRKSPAVINTFTKLKTVSFWW